MKRNHHCKCFPHISIQILILVTSLREEFFNVHLRYIMIHEGNSWNPNIHSNHCQHQSNFLLKADYKISNILENNKRSSKCSISNGKEVHISQKFPFEESQWDKIPQILELKQLLSLITNMQVLFY